MNFDFPDEQKLFAESVRRFAQAHLAKDAGSRAHNPRFPFDVAKLMSQQGLLGITIPEADGGQGGSLMDAVIAIEQTAAVCPRSADIVQFGNFGPIRTFSEYGTDYQKKKWLTECLAGNAVISLGMSEPEAGSAVTDLKTSAKQHSPGYVINGPKVFSTFSPEAAVFLVYVRYGPGVGGIGSVLVERGTPGFTIGPPQAFMSGELWRALHLPPYCSGPAREHAGVRQQFGRPLAEFQGLQWKFADMAIKLEGAQLLLYRAAANADKGLPSAYETAVAKAACNQAGFEIAHEAVQIMGAAGYSKSSLVEYCMRRCRGWMIAGGSIEMLKNRIAEHVFDRRFDQRPPKPKSSEAAE